jgi:hypothetical protein
VKYYLLHIIGLWLIILPVIMGASYAYDERRGPTRLGVLLPVTVAERHYTPQAPRMDWEPYEPQGPVGAVLSIPVVKTPLAVIAGAYPRAKALKAPFRGSKQTVIKPEEWTLPGRTILAMHSRRSQSEVGPELALQKNIRNLVDSRDELRAAGDLIPNAHTIYDRLEIRVTRGRYDLHLVGIKGDRERVLYETKVGLGSPEYPTPRGRWYIARIFDDHPLWIPPANREWAWGQRPSRSVYGGHMMPFLKKRNIRNSVPDDYSLDLISPKVRLADTETYRVHGTDSPWSVGSNQSHGCVRMRNDTVEKLADTIKIYAGTTDRGETENGKYINLKRPLTIVSR